MNLTSKIISTSSGNGEAFTRLDGLIFGVLIQYADAAPATTNVLIEEVEGAERKIVEVVDNNTDYQFVPQIPGISADNVPLATYSMMPVTEERIRISVTDGGTVSGAVTVWFWTE